MNTNPQTSKTAQSTPEKSDFPIWRSIKLGTGFNNAKEFREALYKNGFGISDWANDMLAKPSLTLVPATTTANLILVTVSDLGFSRKASWNDICSKAEMLGLALCPSEVGPQLRLQYRDQPRGEWMLIAMKPIRDSNGDLSIFNVERNDDACTMQRSTSHVMKKESCCFTTTPKSIRTSCVRVFLLFQQFY
jgi:hypothetical protein